MKRTMKRIVLIVLVLMIYFCASTPVFASDSVPLPTEIRIVHPNPNLPPEIKAFSGKWGGRWWNPRCKLGDGYDAVLIVEEIMGDLAIVVYGWGNSFEWNIKKDWSRFNANFSQNEEGITLWWINSITHAKVIFRVKGDKLEGTYHGYYINYITMKRIQ